MPTTSTGECRAEYQLCLDTPDFLVIDKSPGARLHRNADSHSLLDRLRQDLAERQLFPVHRLDDATSGLLIVARHAAAAAEFGRLFESRQVEKFYLAVADGRPKKKQGTVVGDLIKSRGGSYRLSRSVQRPSRTHFFSYPLSPGRRLYLLRPYTGRTHQLRVVMKSLGVAILGDRRYGPSSVNSDRLYLHAYALRFCFSGQEFAICRRPRCGDIFLDGDLQRALLDLEPPWRLKWPKHSPESPS